VRGAPARKPVAFDEPSETAPFRLADNLYQVIGVKHIDEYLIADISRLLARIYPDLAQHARGRHARTLEVTFGRFVDAAGRLLFDQPQLDRVIAITVDGLLLNDHAGAGL
jgi:hypothetical protein